MDEFLPDLSQSQLIPDPRTKNWFLMQPFEMLSVAVIYIVLVFVGKAIMKNREPFVLLGYRIIHNTLLTLISLYLTVEILRQAAATSLFGPIFRDSRGDGMARALYYFYLSKIIEFNDTIIMVLRKKFDQISFLHWYHHLSVLFVWWFNVYFYPGGEAYPSAWLNSFVHIWMYGYYLLSSFGYEVWWRRYITQLQISQLFLFVIQGIYLLFTAAPEFRFIGLINGGYAATLLALFINFYVKSYNRSPRGKPTKKE